ncbi:MAG: hypothetical protein IJW23_00870, partial [Lentisphaeria bacterium]|nr:hypothetical protein [Lentisphaeria bacterium]
SSTRQRSAGELGVLGLLRVPGSLLFFAWVPIKKLYGLYDLYDLLCLSGRAEKNNAPAKDYLGKTENSPLLIPVIHRSFLFFLFFSLCFFSGKAGKSPTCFKKTCFFSDWN